MSVIEVWGPLPDGTVEVTEPNTVVIEVSDPPTPTVVEVLLGVKGDTGPPWVYVGDTPPEAPQDGDLWLDTSSE